MKRNPFNALCFTKDMVEQLRGVQGGPDALLKIAEAHRKYLLIRWHPDRAIGGTEKAADITEAFEEIRDMARREEYIEQFLTPTPDSFSRGFFREDLEMARRRIAELERRHQKLEQESAEKISALKQSRALFAQKLVETYQHVVLPAFSRNGTRQDNLLPLSALPDAFVAVLGQTPGSHYKMLFLVRRNVVAGARWIRTIKGRPNEKNKEPILSVEMALREIRRAPETFFERTVGKRQQEMLLGTTVFREWGTQARTSGDEVIVPAQLLGEYLLKIENGIRVGSVFLTGSCKQKKRKRIDPDEYAFSFNGYLESIHPL